MTDTNDMRNRGDAGFTLVELMVVIAIIAILATIVGFNVFTAMDDASITQAKSQIKNFETALTAYRLKFNRFPSTSEGLDALITNERGVNFLRSKEIPKDPWGQPYLYTSESSREFKIVSYGADRQPGGSGEYDSDITNDLESN
ncbi:MAG: type II secretion system major pseudopilin GspG [Candidatus Hydrogenedentes bacterium]|nr:type II secretion system major pseudopilin GspG [Candidatus Hydrogenedentota bacterium]